ncbi:MAG TPA: TetR/AcrR family transcriptional regulator, partial [Conexibacter sp.]|nr:TetR/AcrR family transcriptional regulator [Conexibacter sp.]
MIKDLRLLKLSFAFKDGRQLDAGGSITVNGSVFEAAEGRGHAMGSIASDDMGDGQRPLHALSTDRRTQRDRLLQGMAQTVARRGYAATPVAEVLKAAGVSRRTFYEQFADKEDCFLAAYDAFVARCTERVITAYHLGDGWEQGIAHAYAALLRTLA